MKKLRKKWAALLLLVLFLFNTFAVSAANNNSVSVDKDNAVFTAYRVFEVTSLGDDADGNPMYSFSLATAFQNFFNGTANSGYFFDPVQGMMLDGNVITEVSEDALGNGTVNNTDMMKLAVALSDYAKAGSIQGGIELSSNSASPTTLNDGYYLIVESSSTAGTGSQVVASKPLLRLFIGDQTTTIHPKDYDIELEKKIIENKGESNETLVDANDVNIGDTIDYQIATSFPVYE